MNKEIIRDEIKWLLEAINEQYATICQHDEKIPQIEFDILMENVRKFYESMHLLQRSGDPLLNTGKMGKSRDGIPVASVVAPEPPKAAEPHFPETGQKVVPQSPVLTVKFSEPEPILPDKVIPDESVAETSFPGKVPFKPAGSDSIRPETAASSRKTSKVPEIDLFAAEEPVFSIKLKEAREKTLGPKTPPVRIENLKTAITINEKFMFINELFDGNLREYNETVETLNGFKNLDQAADFLDLMRKKNFWNTGSNAFKMLKELVERRF